MFFKRLFSKKTFRVKFGGRQGLRYFEDDKKMHISSESLVKIAGQNGVIIYKSSIRNWDSPYDGNILSDSDKERILDNIINHFHERNYYVEIFQEDDLSDQERVEIFDNLIRDLQESGYPIEIDTMTLSGVDSKIVTLNSSPDTKSAVVFHTSSGVAINSFWAQVDYRELVKNKVNIVYKIIP